MTIRHVTSAEDMGALQTWWLTSMPEGAHAVQRSILGACACIGILCGLAAWLVPATSAAMFVVAAFSIAYLSLVSPGRIRQNASAQAVKLHNSGANAALFGERTLEITDDGVLSISRHATSLYRWEAFGAVSVTDTHAFLTMGTMMALVIARDTVKEGNFDAFVAEARRLHRQAKERVPLAAMAQ